MKYFPVSEHNSPAGDLTINIDISRLKIQCEIRDNNEYNEYISGVANFSSDELLNFDSLSFFGDVSCHEDVDDIKILIHKIRSAEEGGEGFCFLPWIFEFDGYPLTLDYSLSKENFDKIKSELRGEKIKCIYSTLNVNNIKGLYHTADWLGPRRFKILNDKIVQDNDIKLPNSFKTTKEDRGLHSFEITIIHKEVIIGNDRSESSEENGVLTKNHSDKCSNIYELSQILEKLKQLLGNSDEHLMKVDEIYHKFSYFRLIGFGCILLILAKLFYK